MRSSFNVFPTTLLRIIKLTKIATSAEISARIDCKRTQFRREIPHIEAPPLPPTEEVPTAVRYRSLSYFPREGAGLRDQLFSTGSLDHEMKKAKYLRHPPDKRFVARAVCLWFVVTAVLEIFLSLSGHQASEALLRAFSSTERRKRSLGCRPTTTCIAEVYTKRQR